ncbi:hypothetical protein CERSUDRAFT_100220 [Gelatoporia subvermispora B]|uniref:Uncharacterized protein n=1 Tax=Ceriporiopsis subvermispora (strain B) TaxID=914234 RepID=M2QZX6_CERS8|nr:hypothetical protein CERSUDRAFT_100220 [Gelatoporia subvermispora B]
MRLRPQSPTGSGTHGPAVDLSRTTGRTLAAKRAQHERMLSRWGDDVIAVRRATCAMWLRVQSPTGSAAHDPGGRPLAHHKRTFVARRKAGAGGRVLSLGSWVRVRGEHAARRAHLDGRTGAAEFGSSQLECGKRLAAAGRDESTERRGSGKVSGEKWGGWQDGWMGWLDGMAGWSGWLAERDGGLTGWPGAI